MSRNVGTRANIARIDGLKETITAAGAIVSDMSFQKSSAAAKQMKNVFVRAGFILVREAKDLAPYGKNRKTGTHLRDAIYVTAGDPSKPNALVGVSNKKAPHAHIEEKGTKVRQTKKGANRGSGPAFHYMRDAFNATKGAMAATIRDGLAQVISDLERKHGA